MLWLFAILLNRTRKKGPPPCDSYIMAIIPNMIAALTNFLVDGGNRRKPEETIEFFIGRCLRISRPLPLHGIRTYDHSTS